MQGNNGTAVMPDWFAENGRIVMVSDWENRDAVPRDRRRSDQDHGSPDGRHHFRVSPAGPSHTRRRDFYRNVVKAIRGEAQLVTHEQVMKVMKVMEAAFRSADTNRCYGYFLIHSQRGRRGIRAAPSPLFHLKQKGRSCTAASLLPPSLSRSNRFHREASFQPPGSAFAFPLARWKAVFQKTIEKASGKA